MLNQTLCYQIACPFGFYITNISIIISGTCGTPTPNVAVCSVGSGLSGIECAAVQHSFTIVRPYSGIISGSCFQIFQRSAFEILYFTHEGSLFRINQIPPVSHLEYIRTFVETIPHHGHKGSGRFPLFQVGRGKFGDMPFSVLAGSDQHVVYTVFGLEQERVTEIILVIAVCISFQVEGSVLGPCLEVGRSSYHHYLRILVGRRFELIAGVEGIIQFVGRVIDRSSCADGSILFVTPSAGNQFAERFVSSTVFGSHPENGMVRSFGVRTVILQVHHFKVLGNRIIEWHRVTYKADLWLIVHREAMLITRLEVCGCTVPVFLSQDGVSLVTASSHRSYQCGKCYR